MEWNYWLNKHVFVQLKSGGFYTGDIVDVDESDKPIIFLTMVDKFGERVTFVSGEIIKIKEENK